MKQSLSGRTVLITGANGGLGEQFVEQALARGAKKVYAAARSPKLWVDVKVQAIPLDITKAEDIASALEAAPDVDLLINNAGIAPAGDSIIGPTDELRRIFETNFFGTLAVSNAFAPVLAANGGGTLLNIISAAAWISVPTGYAASKAAMWSATNSLRVALKKSGNACARTLCWHGGHANDDAMGCSEGECSERRRQGLRRYRRRPDRDPGRRFSEGTQVSAEHEKRRSIPLDG